MEAAVAMRYRGKSKTGAAGAMAAVAVGLVLEDGVVIGVSEEGGEATTGAVVADMASLKTNKRLSNESHSQK